MDFSVRLTCFRVVLISCEDEIGVYLVLFYSVIITEEFLDSAPIFPEKLIENLLRHR